MSKRPEPTRVCVMCGKRQPASKLQPARNIHWQCRDENACASRMAMADFLECVGDEDFD